MDRETDLDAGTAAPRTPTDNEGADATVDYGHRDRVMRAWFQGRTWDENPEFKLKRQLVQATPPELAPFPLLIDDEWEVVPGATNGGRGDLLFTDGRGGFAVVEVKWMPELFGGRTARRARNRKRGAVREQAWTYAYAILRRFPDAQFVRAFVFTDDWTRRGVGLIGEIPRTALDFAESLPDAQDEAFSDGEEP